MQTQHQEIFRAVADPTRRAIIDLLKDEEMTTGAVAQHFAMSRPAVSKHLKILEAGGLVVRHQRGRENYNRLEAARLKRLADWINQFEVYWDDSLTRLKMKVEKDNA